MLSEFAISSGVEFSSILSNAMSVSSEYPISFAWYIMFSIVMICIIEVTIFRSPFRTCVFVIMCPFLSMKNPVP